MMEEPSGPWGLEGSFSPPDVVKICRLWYDKGKSTLEVLTL